jgi:hypothetical protein
MMAKLPYIEFYPGDWLRDSVSGCSLAAQGLWLRMMMIAHDSERYGYLSINGLPIPSGSIASRCGCTPEQYETLFGELTRAGVPSVTSASPVTGIIYSRRMVKDEQARSKHRERQKKYRESQNNSENNSERDAKSDAAVTLLSRESDAASSSSSFTPPVSKETPPPAGPAGGGYPLKISNRKERKRQQDVRVALSPNLMDERREKSIAVRDVLLAKRKNGIAIWWAEQKKKISEEMNPQSFNAFIEPLEALEKTDERLVLLSSFDSVKWVQEHYSDYLSGELGLTVQIIDGTEEE